jgi:hypothetical protein
MYNAMPSRLCELLGHLSHHGHLSYLSHLGHLNTLNPYSPITQEPITSDSYPHGAFITELNLEDPDLSEGYPVDDLLIPLTTSSPLTDTPRYRCPKWAWLPHEREPNMTDSCPRWA